MASVLWYSKEEGMNKCQIGKKREVKLLKSSKRKFKYNMKVVRGEDSESGLKTNS